MRDFQFGKTDAYQQARDASIQGAGEEVSRQGQLQLADRAAITGENANQNTQNLQYAQQNNQNNLTQSNQSAVLRQQALAEAMQRRGFSINEINAILNGQQVAMPQMPGFSTASAAQPVQYLDAAKSQYQSQLDAFNAQQGGFAGLMGGVGALAPYFVR
jgi:DNA-binding transcriptional MerR regulator